MRLSCTAATVGAGSSLHRIAVVSAGPNPLMAAEPPAHWATWVSS